MSRYMLPDRLTRRHRKLRLPRSRRATHSRYCRALRMEPLEDRMVLSTFAHFIDLSAPESGVFPTNVFTVADCSNLTGLRVNLPSPDATTNPADFQDIQVINTLDGFNIQPRLSIPFDGPIDVSTVNSQSVFLVRMGDTTDCRDHRTQIIGINQIVWDPATNTLHVESDELLEQHTRYALVVTDAIRDADGHAVKATKDFRVAPLKLLCSRDPALRSYGLELLQGLLAAWRAGVSPQNIVTASVFTTQSTTAVLEKIRDQIHAGLPEAPATADFNIGLNGEHTVFSLTDNLNKVTGISFVQHTGWDLATGNPKFTTVDVTPTASLNVIPGAVEKVAFGKFESPNYENSEQVIPAVGTRTGTPVVQGYNDIYFTMYLPSGLEPAGGWPVAIVSHGGGGYKDAKLSGVPAFAATMAAKGIATIEINAVGHGFGSLSTLTVTLKNGSTVSLLEGGRGIDQDGNGVIGAAEGFSAAMTQEIIAQRDGRIQTAADFMQLVQVIQAGVDVDGDGTGDLDPSRVYYIGASLGAWVGTPFVAVEPDLTAAVLNTVGGPELERRLGNNRAGASPVRTLGDILAKRELLNTPGVTNLDGLIVSVPYYNENMPLRDGVPLTVALADGTTDVIPSPVTNDVPGAMAIQELLDNWEWVSQPGNPVAIAPYLRKEPLPGMAERPLLVQFAKGDQQIVNPTTSAFLRAGELADLATYYRHDLAWADDPTRTKNPHTYSVLITDPKMKAIALATQQQIAAFFASDGAEIIQPPGVPAEYFEVGMDESELPEGLNFVGVVPPLATGGAAAAASYGSSDMSSGAGGGTWDGGGSVEVRVPEVSRNLLGLALRAKTIRHAEQDEESSVVGGVDKAAIDEAQSACMPRHRSARFHLRDVAAVDRVFADSEWGLPALL